jgi:hypothetical protein
MNLPVLNLAPYEPSLRYSKDESEIFDPFRKKWVRLTAEEWVRQSFLNHLVAGLGYPKGRIGTEITVKYHSLSRRADAVVFDDSGRPQVIIECKAPDIPVTEDVFYQACMYNRPLRAKWLFLTNGLQHVAADISGKEVVFFEEVPAYIRLKNEE